MDNNYTNNISRGLAAFHLTQATINTVLRELMARGADYADIYIQSVQSRRLSLIDHKVDNGAVNQSYGAGVRVVVQGRTGYSYTNEVNARSLMQAARAARSIAEGGNAKMVAPVVPLLCESRYFVRDGFLPVEEQKRYLENIDVMISEADANVIKVSVGSSETINKILFFNSIGNAYYDEQPASVLYASCVMQQGERVERDVFSRMLRCCGADFFTAQLAAEAQKNIVQSVQQLFEASRPKGGEMSVVMAAGASGILLHEAIGHAFEADFVRRGESIFSEMLGQKICDEQITIVDDGTIPQNAGALNFDDEGVPGQCTALVENGRLASFIHDRISAAALGAQPTGNGRRQSYASMPLPRMRATYMLPGRHTEAEMIASVKRGVYVDKFTNGQVQIGAGDFSFYVKHGYLIENGRLTMPIKDINVIGNGPRALADISMVGNDLRIDSSAWMCGKEGQSVPVCCGMPAVKVDKLVVGGE